MQQKDRMPPRIAFVLYPAAWSEAMKRVGPLLRSSMITFLEGAFEIAVKLKEPRTAELIERALREARGNAGSSTSSEQSRCLN
jgi:hypothetical protein